MATQYERGRALEYRVKSSLEKEGYTVSRSAGSHSPWDLVAIRENPGPEVRLIQLKSKVDAKSSQEVIDSYWATVKNEYWVVGHKARKKKV